MSKHIHFKEPIAISEISKFFINKYTADTIIVCIGTDKCTGDSLGPLVGTFLLESNISIPVYGTLQHPIHAVNLNQWLEFINKKHPNSNIIAIDACLGNLESIGEIYLKSSGFVPGKALGKDLPALGDSCLVAIVDEMTNSNIFSLSGIRLNLIYKIARTISQGIIDGYKKIKLLESLNLSSEI